ncbi:MAG TPA: NAD(P)/FAD-dependent oxidoreductase [Anaeromyxobacteraceae bacterium]|nr:NAD(P)/FAD-dependent oxidoreductase [Anaeromyxobacteraceae bacterium]
MAEARAAAEIRHDAVVVGAGIAGLMAATELAARGRRVLVLEHNHQAGGLLSGMWRRGLYFDVGCQSFEDMGIVFSLLDDHGLADLARFRRARYRIAMPGLDELVESLPQMSRAFQAAYPGSAEGFARTFAVHERTSELIRRLFQPDRVPYVRDERPLSLLRWVGQALAGPGWRSPLGVARQLADLRTLMLDDFTAWYERQLPPSGARDLLSRCGYSRMNVFVASAFWHLWAHDYWYPEGGLQPWLDRWVARLEARGVRFLFKRTATALEQEGGRARAVLTHKGERFEADEVVYCGDYRQAVHRLVGAERWPRRELERLDAARHSDALVSAYVGLDMAPEELAGRLRASHVFFFPSFDCRTELDPRDPAAHGRAFLEVTAHGHGAPGPDGRPRASVVLQAFTRHDWLEGWGTGLSGDTAREGDTPPRPPAYRRLKKAVGQELLATFERLVPGARERVSYLDVGSPASAVRFTRNAFGGTCGFELNWRNFPFLNPLAHVETPLRNLHLAGHFTVWPGAVPTAALSGKIAALRADEGLRARRGGRRATPARDERAGRGRAEAAVAPGGEAWTR